MRKQIKKIISLLLCFVCLSSVGAAAFAKLETTDPPALEVGTEVPSSIINEEELSQGIRILIDQYAAAGFIKENEISIAYTYLATGDSWYLNPDTWFYSASMYKVPLTMILAEKEMAGELTPESVIDGFTLAQGEGSVLVDSSNDRAHAMFRFISGKTDKRESEKAVRPLYKAYSSLPDEYYHSDFVNYSYFSARFMNDVMVTLYNEPNRFPHIMGYLKQAEPENYCHLKLGNMYEIAQKYGYYKDGQDNVWNNITAVIYTPNPFVLTVMTDHATKGTEFIGDVAEYLANYTLKLDSELTAHKEALAKAEADRIAAEKAAEEAEKQRIAEEQEAAARAAEEKRLREEQEIKEAQAREKAAARKALMSKVLRYVGIGGGALLFILVVIGVISFILKRKKRAEDERDARIRNAYYDDEEEYEDEEENEEEEDETPVKFSRQPLFRIPVKKAAAPIAEEDEEENEDDEEDEEDENVKVTVPAADTNVSADEENEEDEEAGNAADRQADRFAAFMRSKSESHRSSDTRSSGGYTPRH